MATETERRYLRDDLSVTETALSDDAADILYLRADGVYPSNTAARDAHTRVLAIRQLLASAARQVDYTQGESSEKASQTFDHLKALLPIWEKAEKQAVDDALGATTGGAMFGGLRRKPTRQQEFPDTH